MPLSSSVQRCTAAAFLAALLAGCHSQDDSLAELRSERDQLADHLEKARAANDQLTEEIRQALEQINDCRRQIITANGVRKLIEDENKQLRSRLAAPLVHVVVFRLKNADDADALIDAVHDSLGRLPGVRHYWVGKPVNKTPPAENLAFHVALIMLFDNQETLKQYLEHRSRQDFVEKQLPTWEKLQVFDIIYEAQK